MRIVSQDRKLSVDFGSCELWMQSFAEKSLIYRRVGDDSQVIGVYATPERAAEVFEDIHKAYAPVYSISNNLTEDEVKTIFIKSENMHARNVIGFGEGKEITTYENLVYYMPEK